MVAFSRRCRRLVRRRDKVTLAMHRPPISRRFWLNRLPGDGSCVKLAQRKDLPYGEKKATDTQIRLQIDTSRARRSRRANRCGTRGPSLKMASPHADNRESDDAIRLIHDALAPAGARAARRPSMGPADVAVGR